MYIGPVLHRCRVVVLPKLMDRPVGHDIEGRWSLPVGCLSYHGCTCRLSLPVDGPSGSRSWLCVLIGLRMTIEADHQAPLVKREAS